MAFSKLILTLGLTGGLVWGACQLNQIPMPGL